jgi:hypothetical protein
VAGLVLVVLAVVAVVAATGGGSPGAGAPVLRAPFDGALQALAQAPGVRYHGDWNVKEYINDVAVTAHGERYGTSHLSNSTMDTDKDAQDLLSVGGKDYSRWHNADSAASDLNLWTYDDIGNQDTQKAGASRLSEEMSLYLSPAQLAKKFTQALADQPRLPSADHPQTTVVDGVTVLRADTTAGYLYVSMDAPYRFLRWEPPSAMRWDITADAPLPRAVEAHTPLSDTTSVRPSDAGQMYDALEKDTKDLATARYGGLMFDKTDGSGVNCDSSGCHVKEVVSAQIASQDAIVQQLSQVNVVMTVGSIDVDGNPAGTCTSPAQPMQRSGSNVSGTLTCDDPAGGPVFAKVNAQYQGSANASGGTTTFWDHAEDITIEALVLSGADVDQLVATEVQEQAAAR